MAIQFTVLGTRPADNPELVVVTVSTPDYGQANITVPKKVAESSDLTLVVEKMLHNREDTRAMLRE